MVGKAGTPRSYLEHTPTTCLRRNRRHLVPTPNVTLEPMATENRVIEDSDVARRDIGSTRGQRDPLQLVEHSGDAAGILCQRLQTYRAARRCAISNFCVL